MKVNVKSVQMRKSDMMKQTKMRNAVMVALAICVMAATGEVGSPSWASDGDQYSPWMDGVVEWTDGDGTTIRTGALPDDAKKGVAFEFPPKSVRWVMFTVEKVNKGGCHVGLSEIAVF